jgi:bacterial/archaeal transporter family protein
VTWLIAVLLSTMFFAWVTVLDKKLITDLFPDMRDFYLVFALMQWVIGPAFLAVAWANGGFGGVEGIAWSIASGFGWVSGLLLFFYGLRIVDVSRAAPLQSLSTVFATLIAVVLLGERLTPTQAIAVVVVVTGAALVSLTRVGGRFRFARGRALLVLVASALGIGIAFVVTKQATEYASVWAVQGVSTLVLGLVILAIVGRRDRFARVPTMARNRHLVWVMLLTEGALAPAAVGTLMLAFSLGTVSLVSVVAASRPLLVLIISVALSTRAWDVLHEPLDRETLGLKAFSTLLIVGGVAVLTV